MIHLCEYGCGQPATFFKQPSSKLPNGRHMCASSPNSCPAKRFKTTGDNNPSRRPEVREKIKQINSILFASGSELRNKCQSKLIEKYGVSNPGNIPGARDSLIAKRKANGTYCYRPEMNSWEANKKRKKTRIEKGYDVPIELKEPFAQYEQMVDRITEQSYKKFKHIINPAESKRGRTKGHYQLDHILSKVDGFKQNIAPELLAHPVNLRMLPISQNISKSSQSHITKPELIKLIEQFDLTH
jgi:hypothetical protein